jgi:hypothetical protein
VTKKVVGVFVRVRAPFTDPPKVPLSRAMAGTMLLTTSTISARISTFIEQAVLLEFWT